MGSELRSYGEKFSLRGGASLISVADQATHQQPLAEGMVGASTW